MYASKKEVLIVAFKNYLKINFNGFYNKLFLLIFTNLFAIFSLKF